MKIRAAVAFGLAVKIPVFDVHAHGQAHVGVGGQLFAARAFVRRAAELENGRVFALHHFGAQFDFHRAAVAGVGDKIPDGGRTGVERREIFEIERRKKAVGVHPDAEALHENVAIHRHGRDSGWRRARSRIWNSRGPNPRTAAPCRRCRWSAGPGRWSAESRSAGCGVRRKKTNRRRKFFAKSRRSVPRSISRIFRIAGFAAAQKRAK